jgi:hypothetical protein
MLRTNISGVYSEDLPNTIDTPIFRFMTDANIEHVSYDDSKLDASVVG